MYSGLKAEVWTDFIIISKVVRTFWAALLPLTPPLQIHQVIWKNGNFTSNNDINLDQISTSYCGLGSGSYLTVSPILVAITKVPASFLQYWFSHHYQQNDWKWEKILRLAECSRMVLLYHACHKVCWNSPETGKNIIWKLIHIYVVFCRFPKRHLVWRSHSKDKYLAGSVAPRVVVHGNVMLSMPGWLKEN